MTETHHPSTVFIPTLEDVPAYTDKYFTRTKEIVSKFGDRQVTYAVFLRRPVLFAPRLAVSWLENILKQEGSTADIKYNYREGDWVGAGEPMMYITGSFAALVEKETILLQKLGAACVAAYNASSMCQELPHVEFLAMDARHCAGSEMAELMAYAAAVGSEAAKKSGAKGFVGTANDATAIFFGLKEGLGTMPHALIGYAGSTVRAAEMYHETFPDQGLTVLVDYFGREVTDGLEVCRRFPELAAAGRLALRLDTHGGRFIEGLDTPKSYAVLEKNAPESIRGYRKERELRLLIGTGVSAAAVWHMRDSLDAAGFDKVKIVVSSGFSAEKCHVMSLAHAPIDIVGTGSYLPEKWTETYGTADIIRYDNEKRVKVGREFLLDKLDGIG